MQNHKSKTTAHTEALCFQFVNISDKEKKKKILFSFIVLDQSKKSGTLCTAQYRHPEESLGQASTVRWIKLTRLWLSEIELSIITASIIIPQV